MGYIAFTDDGRKLGNTAAAGLKEIASKMWAKGGEKVNADH